MPTENSTQASLKESLDEAINSLESIKETVTEIYFSIAKWNHPLCMEIGGLVSNIQAKIERVKQVRRIT